MKLPSAEAALLSIMGCLNHRANNLDEMGMARDALIADRNSVLEGVAEMVDEEREKTFAGQPYFVMLAKKIRKLKDGP